MLVPRRVVRVELTVAEAEALLASNRHTAAGDLLGVFADGRGVRTFERADGKVRAALREVQQDARPAGP